MLDAMSVEEGLPDATLATPISRASPSPKMGSGRPGGGERIDAGTDARTAGKLGVSCTAGTAMGREAGSEAV